jgi:hypothetical protein
MAIKKRHDDSFRLQVIEEYLNGANYFTMDLIIDSPISQTFIL